MFIKTHLLICVDMFVLYEGESPMITEPKVEDRTEQHYLAIRTQVPMKEFKRVVPQLLGEVFAWLEKQGVAPAGAPFVRFHRINTAGKMDLGIGGPGDWALLGHRRGPGGAVPAG